MSDNVRVSVQWKSNTVFAGEHIECIITFTNASQSRRSTSPRPRGIGSSRDRWKDSLSSPTAHTEHHTHDKVPSVAPSSNVYPRFHKAASSVGEANGGPKLATPDNGTTIVKGIASGEKSHRRSVSIVSIGGDTIEESTVRGPPLRQRPGQAHMRAASLQILPRRSGFPGPKTSSVLNNDRAFTVPSPLFRAASSFSGQDNGAQRGHLSRSQRPITTPRLIKTGEDQFAGFQFPSEGGIDKGRTDLPKKNITSKSSDPLRRALSHLPSDRVPVSDQLSPVTKILSPASLNGTPRSSGEFYSLSNNSTETLASEHITPETSQMLRRPVHTRQGSSLAPIKMPKAEVLMMGFGQITGSFTLEGSLVNQSPFEEVKRKGIVGGQGGGGMVRSQSTKRDSGILGSFGWGNIGETFGGLLGDSGMSSMKEAKKSSSTKSIPILSAPQSILFVDLQLAPGESRSYLFSHPLPRGIPASYRGKAIKINYNLVIGTQRAAKIAQQNQIKRVEIPFRVFPCINTQGDVLGHDLMSPHTLLSNSATVSSLQDPILANTVSRLSPANSKSTSSSNDFSSYVKKLLQRPEGSANSGLLSPTEEESRILGHGMDQPSSMRGRIDLAILNSNASTSSKRNVNRFEINRNGEKVAVIMLSRPAYRLGETVPIVIDLSEADVACYSLHSTLESSESIDPVIALRSKASVQRVTRRIHASHHESTISSHRIHFSPVIPPSATPEFITTGVNLDWNLRFEFVTSRSGGDEYDVDSDDLMEEVSRDERGSVKAAVQGFPCEIFDVAVPLRVYGAVAAFDENMESGSFPI